MRSGVTAGSRPYQMAAELPRPRSASVLMRGSRSARNSPARMPCSMIRWMARSYCTSKARMRLRAGGGTELTRAHALLDDPLDGALVLHFEGADALARRRRQEAPFAQEHDGEVAPIGRSVVKQHLGYFGASAGAAA